MSLPLPDGARVRVALCDADAPAYLCGLARAGHGRTALQWTDSALADREDAGANLAIRQAPLTSGVHQVGSAALNGLPGFLADSLPDHWGRLLLDRQLRARGVLSASLSGFDRLALVGVRGPGALVYEPEVSLADAPEMEIDLDGMAESAEVLLAGRDPDLLDRLAEAGGSAGGTRPKAWLAEAADGTLRSGSRPLLAEESGWLVKFRAPAHDPPDVGTMELAYSRMAAAAGLAVPEPRLFETRRGRYFASRRFDRIGHRRVHVLTAAGLLDVSHEQAMAADYVDLLKLTRHVTRSDAEVVEAFRHAAFNVLAHNRDDHLKQFAFLRRGGAWQRAPAYDLTFSHGPRGEHTLLVAGAGKRPDAGDLQRVGERVGVRKRTVARVLEQTRQAVAGWKSFARDAGVSAATTTSVWERIRD